MKEFAKLGREKDRKALAGLRWVRRSTRQIGAVQKPGLAK